MHRRATSGKPTAGVALRCPAWYRHSRPGATPDTVDSALEGITCRSCGERYDPDLTSFPCPACGGILDPQYAYDTVDIGPETWERRDGSMWVYHELLPVTDADAIEAGVAQHRPWEQPETVARGVEIPDPGASPWLLSAVADSGGRGVAVTDDDVVVINTGAGCKTHDKLGRAADS